jgi:hypothetical protein
MKEKYDTEEFYCPKLGHHLTGKIPIQEYLASQYPEERIAQIFTPSEAKLTSIVNLIEKAQRSSR